MPPQRIVVVGCSGSGKSTLARKLGQRLALPVVHLDVLHYLPGWTRASLADFRDRVTKAHQGEAWISEGNFASWTFDIRLPRAEALVALDRPRWPCLWRVFRRAAMERDNRPDLPNGCAEQIDHDLLDYTGILERSEDPNRRRGSSTPSSGAPPNPIATSPRFWHRYSSVDNQDSNNPRPDGNGQCLQWGR